LGSLLVVGARHGLAIQLKTHRKTLTLARKLASTVLAM